MQLAPGRPNCCKAQGGVLAVADQLSRFVSRPQTVSGPEPPVWHFERDPIPYALETDWPVGAAGFEPLHLRIEFANTLSRTGEVEHAHLE